MIARRSSSSVVEVLKSAILRGRWCSSFEEGGCVVTAFSMGLQQAFKYVVGGMTK